MEIAGYERLEDFFLAAEITEGADVGDDEGGGETIFGADLAEVDAAILEGKAAAVSVIADLDELALEDLVGEIVADAGCEIEALAGQVAVTEKGADLVGKRLVKGHEAWRGHEREIGLDGVIVQAEVGDGGEELAVRLDLEERANGREALNLRIVLEDLFKVVEAAGSDLEIADDGRPIARAESKGKR